MKLTELQLIEEKALNLEVIERELLANHLFQSVHHHEITQIDSAWLEEAEKKYQEYLTNPAIGISQHHIFDEIKSELKWK